MFSIMTMASSTTNPVEMVSAISDRLSRLKPSRYMTPNVPISDSGTDSDGISVARQGAQEQEDHRDHEDHGQDQLELDIGARRRGWWWCGR